MRLGTRRRILSDLVNQDQGIGLLLVIGISAMMAILLTVITATAVRSLGSSAAHVSFEQSLAAAEAGIDEELSRIQTARNQVPTEFYETEDMAPGCSVDAPESTFASEAAEKTWARNALEGLDEEICTRTNGQGEYVAFKVPDQQVVYSLGWSPSRDNPNAKERLLKAEYIFGPYRPGQAILTGGSLNFSGSASINAISGLPADVHTNSDVIGTAGVSITGAVSASGSVQDCSKYKTPPPGNSSAPCLTAQPPERVPVANPRAVYGDYAHSTPQWFDLCPDGTVRENSTNKVPCDDGEELGSSGYNDWFFTPGDADTPAAWILNPSGTSYPGVYYVYGADAFVGDGGRARDTLNISVLAEAVTPPSGYDATSTCGKYGGDINWRLVSIVNRLRGVIFIAQGSIGAGNTPNATAESGLMMAGDNINLNTSSTTVKGSLVANNTCTESGRGANSVQGVTVTYDESVEAPVYSVVNTTLWLEYTG